MLSYNPKHIRPESPLQLCALLVPPIFFSIRRLLFLLAFVCARAMRGIIAIDGDRRLPRYPPSLYRQLICDAFERSILPQTKPPSNLSCLLHLYSPRAEASTTSIMVDGNLLESADPGPSELAEHRAPSPASLASSSAETAERAYYRQGKFFIKRALRPSEYKATLKGRKIVPRNNKERLQNEVATMSQVCDMRRIITEVIMPRLYRI